MEERQDSGRERLVVAPGHNETASRLFARRFDFG
jgi:hypothetical protein